MILKKLAKGRGVKKNKVAAITGAGKGIGRSAAELFAAEGAQVIVLEVDESAGRETGKAIRAQGGKAAFVKTDISNPKAVQEAFKTIEHEFGALQVLYNNASVFLGGRDAPVAELDLEVWNKILAINLYGLFYCCKYEIPLIIRSGGDEEERRLFYVAVTRAKDDLYLCMPSVRRDYNGGVIFLTPSRFLLEVPPESLKTEQVGFIA